MIDLRLCRSLLFVPASNAGMIDKARNLPADLIILDLEDAVPFDCKPAAREGAAAALSQGFGNRPVAVRLNAIGSDFYGEDIVAIRRSTPDFVVLPKAESARQVAEAAGLGERPVLAMIETPTAVLEAPDIAKPAAALIAGTNDLGASLGVAAAPGRPALVYALQHIVLAARSAGIPAFDGVYNKLAADDGLVAECAQGRAFGFDGKSVIHPSQIEAANRAFTPTEVEIADAVRLIEAAGEGAERYEGRMIEAMHVEEARRLIAKARLSVPESLASRNVAP